LFTENGVMIDFEELNKVVDECDVFTVGFRMFPQRLVVDTRNSDNEGPMLEVVEPVNTVEERFFWLGKRRPSFGVPERFTFFVWPHSQGFFVESGLADRIRQRVEPADRSETAGSVDEALAELERLEMGAIQDALTGRNYHTLWPSS
jgi:hypothetical protein